MAVPTDISDLSTTAASNSPAGSDAIGTSLDDFLRTIQAIQKQMESEGSQIASAATITIPDDGIYFDITGTTGISGINDAWNGRNVILHFASTVTLTHSAGLIVFDDANYTTTAGDLILAINTSAGVWELSPLNFNNSTLKTVTGNIIPNVDDTYDLGSASFEWKDLYIDGTANIDTASITGTATIGTANVTTLTASGAATFNGNVTLGNADTDSVTFNADVVGHLEPNLDNSYDLGASGKEWKDLYIDGTAYIDAIATGCNITTPTITSPTITGSVSNLVLDLPQINDTSDTHQYVFAVNELAADRTVTLPLLTGNDEFVFAAHTQNLSNKTFTDATSFNGDVTLGDADTDSVTFNADIVGHLEPNADNTYDLGASGKEWRNLYVDGIGYIDRLDRPLLYAMDEQYQAVGASDCDLSTGTYFSKTITTTTTFTFSNPATSGTVSVFILELTNGGSQTVNFPTGVDWAAGAAPTLTTAGVDILTFVTRDGGTTWHGIASSLDSK